ncbi:MAG: hypothetical protein ABI206_02140, partial [Antricoccus sp.]
ATGKPQQVKWSLNDDRKSARAFSVNPKLLVIGSQKARAIIHTAILQVLIFTCNRISASIVTASSPIDRRGYEADQ